MLPFFLPIKTPNVFKCKERLSSDSRSLQYENDIIIYLCSIQVADVA